MGPESVKDSSVCMLFHMASLCNCRIHPAEDRLRVELNSENSELPVFIINTGNLRGLGSLSIS